SVVTRLDADHGDTLWTESFPGADTRPARLRTLAALPGGDVVAGGEVRTSATNLDASLLRLAAGDGAVGWRVEQNGVAAGEDDAAAVRFDAAGDMFVAGTLENAYLAGQFSLAVVKLAQKTGQELWRREIDGMSSAFVGSYDSATDLAVDSHGDPIA